MRTSEVRGGQPPSKRQLSEDQRGPTQQMIHPLLLPVPEALSLHSSLGRVIDTCTRTEASAERAHIRPY